MKKTYWIFIKILFSLSIISCNNDDSDFDSDLSPGEINSFIYRGLNALYLYKDQSPDLADNRFPTTDERNNFILNGGTPRTFFNSLLIPKDRFSFIINDFERLENFFKGVQVNDGLQFTIEKVNNTDEIYIAITDIVKGSPADIAGIKRGMLFNRVNGIKLNESNTNLLFQNTVTLGEVKFEDATLVEQENEFTLTKVELKIDPIAISKVIEVENKKIGYLQYNSFISGSEEKLNDEFANFKATGVTDFILDLRYNGGGSISTAKALCGMITGQFKGQIFSKRQWNSQVQQEIQNRDPESLINKFVTTTDEGTPLNSLNLTKLYVITTKEDTASASELVINSLRAYIDVVVVGSKDGTVGKSQASRTVYDSASLLKRNINPAHKYAMQPLIFKTVNNKDEGVPLFGIVSDIDAIEEPLNLGVLGDPEEPLLKMAINDILGKTSDADIPSAKIIPFDFSKSIGNSKQNDPNYQRMYDIP